MRLVVARCSARYEGRLGATLSSAVRLVVVKADGSIAIHADAGAYKPLNWMNPPNTLLEEPAPLRVNEAGRWTVTGPRGERLVIEFDEVIDDRHIELDGGSGLELDGVERELQELLASAPDRIEHGLRLVRREWQTDIGPVDLLCRDSDGRAVAVEVKRVGEIASVDQLVRYVERLDRDPMLTPVRGVLVATVVKPQARVHAAARSIHWVEVALDELRQDREPPLRLF